MSAIKDDDNKIDLNTGEKLKNSVLTLKIP